MARTLHALQRQNTEISKQIFPEKEYIKGIFVAVWYHWMNENRVRKHISDHLYWASLPNFKAQPTMNKTTRGLVLNVTELRIWAKA